MLMKPDLPDRLRQHVATLARTPREPGTPEHRHAREYIADQLRTAGFTVRQAIYPHGRCACSSLLTEPVPDQADLPLLVIGAHYDSVPGSPGADDNASAVAALLELAHWIGLRLGVGRSNTARLQLAAYDMEELGFVGSSNHADEIVKAKTPSRGMISLEMLGFTDHRPGSQQLPPQIKHLYPDVGNFIGICGNDASLKLLEVVAAGMKAVPGLPVECLSVPGNGEVLPPVRLSDHSPFWDRGLQALMITDTSFMRNPHYHQATDKPETLDYAFLAKVTEGVCQAADRLLH